MRVDFDPAEMESRDFYRLMTSVLVPRPIAWVATISAEGVTNLAPHSFFTGSCTDPPVIQFTSVRRKDSQTNAEATREFTVSICPEEMFEQVNATATDFPPDQSEFEQVGIETEPSAKVAPPRVAGSPACFECRLLATQSFGDSTVLFGRVVHAALREDVVADDGLADVERLRPLARLGRNEWATIGDIKRIDRIRYPDWADGWGPTGTEEER